MNERTSTLKNKILTALNRFYQSEYEIPFNVNDFGWDKQVTIAYTDEVEDSEETYYYSINAIYDFASQQDIYVMSNGTLTLIFKTPCTYENLIDNLQGGFDAWVSCENGMDYDDVSELTDRFLNGESLEKIQSEIQEKIDFMTITITKDTGIYTEA